MKKHTVTAALAGLLVLSSAVPALAADVKPATGIQVWVDGKKEAYKIAPIVRNKQVLIPLRQLATSLGIPLDAKHITFNTARQSTTIRYDQATVVLVSGSPEAQINGIKVPLSTSTILTKQGVTYVPVDVVKEAWGKQVIWDPASQTLQIGVSNKDKVVEILKSFETGNTKAAEAWISKDQYIQHNPSFASGRDAFLQGISQSKGANVLVEVQRVIQDGNDVAVHYKKSIAGKTSIGFDIFRFDSNGKIVEHWDNMQDSAPTNPSGHTMIDGTTQITDLNQTETNKTLIRKFVDDVLVGKNRAALESYYSGDQYIQHNPLFGDGVSSLKQALSAAGQGASIGYDQVHMVLGEGNFVLVVSELKSPKGTSAAVYDLFRVENGKIAEHWDVVQEIPAKTEWKNTNGKF
ncbi:nuclear transport factor 2 family protein [Paenibacillus sp. AK121]|uniref:stalk domain-containing protein n=1 Tax=Paenibacillus TaxID=44249 RepID=UPI001C2129C0|nr:stalk domain-containing protein [Paenibacillus sp. AK121]MBU9709003.1 nuclear transport factor 2 family protein [Paenibacillus sp. AK121]MEE4569042.1 stalk domain-containing protein [Paenibacillus polymyxa]